MGAQVKCDGRRRQWRGNKWGTFKCRNKAVGTVETHLGFTEHHHVCSSDECWSSITQGYTARFIPFEVMT